MYGHLTREFTVDCVVSVVVGTLGRRGCYTLTCVSVILGVLGKKRGYKMCCVDVVVRTFGKKGCSEPC